jgi:hypothetical protein
LAHLKDLIVNGAARILGNIYGNLKGNADTATKATQDASGNIITNTYATKTELTTGLTSHAHGSITKDGALDTASAVVVTDSTKKVVASTSITTTELGYLDGVTSNIQTQLNGKAPTSHASTATTYGAASASNYGHAMASSTSPKANGTAAVGSETAKFARGDHVHPLQTTVSGNAGSANKVNKALTIKLNGGSTEGTDKFTFDGSAAKTVDVIPTSLKGAKSGVAELDTNGKVPTSQLPSYVDDVIEYSAKASFPAAGETGKIYVDTSTNKTYRWSGSAYVEISASLALGTTSSTAYRGDYGNVAYTHSQAAHAPSDAEKNVQSDWSVTDSNSDAYIKNKPTIPTGAAANKGVDTSISASSTSTNLPTSKAVAAFVEGKGYYTKSAANTDLGTKLDKLPCEWVREYSAGGTAGYLLIGSFPMYDSNITINIDSTTTTTYHGTLVIATQNVSTTSIGSAHTITVYDDPTGTISNAIRVTWNSGSSNYNVYFTPSTWSKTFIHIRGLGNNMEKTDESKICTFTAGTAPATTSGLTVVNALIAQLDTKASSSHGTHVSYGTSATAVGASASAGTAATVSRSDHTHSLSKNAVTTALGYTPPTTDTTYSAAGSALGLVKSGGDVTISSGTITVNDDSHNHVISNIDNLQTTLDGKQAKGNYVSYTTNTNVSVASATKPTYTFAPPNADSAPGTSNASAYFPEGIIMGGTAASAGLMTRGICGISTPAATTGECTKDNLYLNYDGSNDYSATRQVVLQAGAVGSHYGNNLYQFAAARGDAVKNYCDSHYATAAHTHSTYAPADHSHSEYLIIESFQNGVLTIKSAD